MPFPQNCPALQDLPDLPLQEIAALPAEMLGVLQHEAETALKRAKTIKARLDGALALKYEDRAAEARRAAGKDAGVVRFDDGDVTVVADLPKRVDWDQGRLAALVERIRASGENPADYVETSFKVSERSYGAWPPAIRATFEPARTVRTGQLGVQLLADGAR
jgi:hypothetical protein